MSPALADGFLTTAPPGKPQFLFLFFLNADTLSLRPLEAPLGGGLLRGSQGLDAPGHH